MPPASALPCPAPAPGIRRLISAFCFPHFCFAACAAMSKNQAPGARPAPKNSLPFQLFSFSAFQLLPQALHPPPNFTSVSVKRSLPSNENAIFIRKKCKFLRQIGFWLPTSDF